MNNNISLDSIILKFNHVILQYLFKVKLQVRTYSKYTYISLLMNMVVILNIFLFFK